MALTKDYSTARGTPAGHKPLNSDPHQDHVTGIDKQIDGLMKLLPDTTKQAVMRRYKDKIEALERDKARYRDQVDHMTDEKCKSYAERLEPALSIVTKP